MSELSKYDTLECPLCAEPTKPTAVKGGQYVKYQCKGACSNAFFIDWDGELIE